MNRPGEQLLSGSGLPADQHGDVPVRRDPRSLLQALPQRRAATENGLESVRAALHLGEFPGFDPAGDSRPSRSRDRRRTSRSSGSAK